MRKEHTSAKTTRITAVEKGSIHEVVRPPPSNVHMIKGQSCNVWLYGGSMTRYMSELGSISKKALHLKLLNSHQPCFDADLER